MDFFEIVWSGFHETKLQQIIPERLNVEKARSSK
jgi:hypothetical protein